MKLGTPQGSGQRTDMCMDYHRNESGSLRRRLEETDTSQKCKVPMKWTFLFSVCWNDIIKFHRWCLQCCGWFTKPRESENPLEPFKDPASQPPSRPAGITCVFISSSGDFFKDQEHWQITDFLKGLSSSPTTSPK